MSFKPRATRAAKPLRKRADDVHIGGEVIGAGETRDMHLAISQRYTGSTVELPLRIQRAVEPGPMVVVTAVVHGDELNGIGVVRSLMIEPIELARGTLVLVPVVNVLGFERHSRYLPDRRDLNRCFPGSARGSLASRFAHAFFSQVVRGADYLVDLHSAAEGRVNFPHIRADRRDPTLAALARSFGCELLVDHPGNPRSLRAAATRAGCKAILLEAGEAMKIEPSVAALGSRGVRNVLAHVGCVEAEIIRPAYQTVVTESSWLRAPAGGLVRFHVAPGELVDRGARIATIDNLFDGSQRQVKAPNDGVVLGMPTMPAVKPGEPLCHLAVPKRPLARIRAEIARAPGTLHRTLQEHQAGVFVNPRAGSSRRRPPPRTRG